jgi:hypothetical protein
MPGGTAPQIPRVAQDRIAELEGGEEELAAVVVDRTGRVLSRQAWPAATTSYHERGARPGGGPMRVRVVRKRRDHRKLDVDVPPGGEFVVFYRASARRRRGAGGAPPVVTVQRRVLRTLYLSHAPEAPMPAVPPIAGLAVTTPPVKIAYETGPHAPPVQPSVRAVERRRALRPYGRLLDETFTLHPRAKPGRRFDIVIIGDGFAENDQKKFNRQAKEIIRGIRRIEPFRRHDRKINYHILYAVSKDSGINGFDPRRTEQGMVAAGGRRKKTYFRFTSDLTNVGEPGFFGVRTMELIEGATEKITPYWSEVDLVIAIMNCKYPGGAGYSEHRLAVVSRGSEDTFRSFVDRTAHECGHAVARFAEERVTEDRYHPPEWYPNMATEKQRSKGKIWWKRLAKRAELRSRKAFTVEHLYPQLLKPNEFLDPKVPASAFKKLGVFWGCQCTTGPLGYDPDEGFQNWTIQQLVAALKSGRSFYRGMARCRMRDVRSPFCRVCSEVLSEAIRAAARSRPLNWSKFGGN